eukprot:TRINITY_DN46521_c0_g1_i1.p1 TRINITY_DN46521_c0_g1~~TRINITY_DN46521_c0_g1_i1.p1  ORF type:complete len:1325 (-),score=185.27 TRINITY_DN46521_c0_g1_i1:608-4582(-)
MAVASCYASAHRRPDCHASAYRWMVATGSLLFWPQLAAGQFGGVDVSCSAPTVTEVPHAASPSCAEGETIPQNGVCTTVCQKGYTPSLAEVGCLFGQLGVGMPPPFVCIEDDCVVPDPSTVENGNSKGLCAEGGTIAAQSSCTTQCAEHYTPATSTLSCARGELMPSTFVCNENGCPVPSDVAFAKDPPCAEGTFIEAKKNCTAQCQDGYYPSVAPDPFSDGLLPCRRASLIPATFECLELPCLAPFDIAGAMDPSCKEGNLIPSGGVCSPVCQENWGSDSLGLKCDRGVLAPSTYTCVYGRCSVPVGIENVPLEGACVGATDFIDHQMNCTTQCAKGYYPSVKTLACSDATLVPASFECLEMPCQPPTGINNSNISMEPVPSGSFLNVTCEEGYFSPVAALECDRGVLTPPTFKCGPMPCIPPSDITNAAEKPCEEHPTRILDGERCTPQCADGFAAVIEGGMKFLECSLGILHPPRFQCLRVPCYAPDVAFSASPSCHEGGELQHGGTCTAKCRSGYTPRFVDNEGKVSPDDPVILHCARGVLSGEFLCEGNPCKAPPPGAIAHAADPACEEGDVVPHRGTCTPQCLPGFLPSADSIFCEGTLLSPSSFTCLNLNDAGGSEISFTMTLRNVEYSRIVDNPLLEVELKTELRRSVADYAGRSVDPERHVQVELAPGSVLVHVTILPEVDISADKVLADLAASLEPLARTIVERSAYLDGMQEATTGPIVVTDFRIPARAAGSWDISQNDTGDIGTVNYGVTANMATLLVGPSKIITCWEDTKKLQVLCTVLVAMADTQKRGPDRVVAEDRVHTLVLSPLGAQRLATDESRPVALLCYTSRNQPSGICTVLVVDHMVVLNKGNIYAGPGPKHIYHPALVPRRHGQALLCFQRASLGVGCQIMEVRSYQRLAARQTACPPGTEITTYEDCERAVLAFGHSIADAMNESNTSMPEGCSMSAVGQMFFNNIAVGVARDDLRPVCLRPLAESHAPAAHHLFEPQRDMAEYESNGGGPRGVVANATGAMRCAEGKYVISRFEAPPGDELVLRGVRYSSYTIFGCTEDIGFDVIAKGEHAVRQGVAAYVAIAPFKGQPTWQPHDLEGFMLCVADSEADHRAACLAVAVDEAGNETMVAGEEAVVHHNATAYLAMASLGGMRSMLCFSDWSAGETGHCLTVGASEVLDMPEAAPTASEATNFSNGITRYIRLQPFAEHRGQHVDSAYRAMVYYQHGSVVRRHPAMCNVVTALERIKGVTVGPALTVDDGIAWSLSLTRLSADTVLSCYADATRSETGRCRVVWHPQTIAAEDDPPMLCGATGVDCGRVSTT